MALGTTRQCPACGEQLRGSFKFCPNCGHAAAVACPKCSSENQGNASYCTQCGASLEIEAAEDSRSERRVLTLMFCDLEGSTPLSGELDVEDFALILKEFHERVGRWVEGAGGYVLKVMGDGVLAYFGYPIAHEDDARRAVAAALEIVAEQAASGADLSVRVGLHTGRVLLEDSQSGSTRHVADAFGEAPAFVARLQHEAPPNGVVVSQSTRLLVEGSFETESIGLREMRGISDGVPVFRVVGTGFGWARGSPPGGVEPPFVGRQPELDAMVSAFEAAALGGGRVVILSGEPGIGKSRLLQEFLASVGAEHVSLIECRELSENQEFAPLATGLLDRLSALGDADTELDVAFGALARSCGVVEGSSEELVIRGLLGLSPGEETMRRSTPDRLVDLVTRGMTKLLPHRVGHAKLLVVEDLQWADSGTREFVSSLLDTADPTAGLLVVCTHRNDMILPWPLRPHISGIPLSRLGDPDIRQIVDAVLSDSESDLVHSEVTSKAEGVPLFALELARFVDSDVETGPSTEGGLLDVPGTLVELITARLDRLGPARALAQGARGHRGRRAG